MRTARQGGLFLPSRFFILETHAGREADVAPSQWSIVLEFAGGAPRIHVENIVRGKRQGQLRIGRKRMPIERSIDHRVTRRRSLVGGVVVLRPRVLDFDPPVDLPARSG